MTVFFDERRFISTDATEEQARKFWALYKKTGYDSCCCFARYLRSNGFEARQCRSPLQPFLPDVYFSGN